MARPRSRHPSMDLTEYRAEIFDIFHRLLDTPCSYNLYSPYFKQCNRIHRWVKIPNWWLRIESSAIVVVHLREEVRMKQNSVKIAVRNTTIANFSRSCHSSSYCVIEKTALNPVYSVFCQLYDETGPFTQYLFMESGLASRCAVRMRDPE